MADTIHLVHRIAVRMDTGMLSKMESIINTEMC
jgi:hypothetical protein